MTGEYVSKNREKRAWAAKCRHADAFGTSVDTRLAYAADAYLLLEEEDPGRDDAWKAVEEWMTASYECEGYTNKQLDRMDVVSAAVAYIERRRGNT